MSLHSTPKSLIRNAGIVAAAMAAVLLLSNDSSKAEAGGFGIYVGGFGPSVSLGTSRYYGGYGTGLYGYGSAYDSYRALAVPRYSAGYRGYSAGYRDYGRHYQDHLRARDCDRYAPIPRGHHHYYRHPYYGR